MNYRAEIKRFARNKLSSQYGTTLGAMLLAYLPSFIVNAFIFAVVFIFIFIMSYTNPAFNEADTSLNFCSKLGDILCLLFAPFYYVGLDAFLLSAVRGKRETAVFPYVIGGKTYARSLPAAFLMSLFIGLWSLLLIVPGIVKAYSYSFTSFIISDCPNLGALDAINLSKKMTKGIKRELFFFDLSFIGWWILTALTFGILAIYTVPYYRMAKATLYESMKNSALTSGKITEQDLDPYFGTL